MAAGRGKCQGCRGLEIDGFSARAVCTGQISFLAAGALWRMHRGIQAERDVLCVWLVVWVAAL